VARFIIKPPISSGGIWRYNTSFRTNNVYDYLDYTIQNAELKDGQKILDAGCGVGGPAYYFASKLNVVVDGITSAMCSLKRRMQPKHQKHCWAT